MHLHDGVERTCKENILKRQSLITKKPKSTGTSLPLSWCQVKTNWTCFKLPSIYKRADTRLWNRTTSSQRKSNLYLHLFIKGKREIFLLIGTHRWAYKVWPSFPTAGRNHKRRLLLQEMYVLLQVSGEHGDVLQNGLMPFSSASSLRDS